MTTIWCLLFPLIFSSSLSPFSIDRLAFSFRINLLLSEYIVHVHVWLVQSKLMAKTTLEIIPFTCPYNHTTTFRYHNFKVRQLLPYYNDFFNFSLKTSHIYKRRHLRSFNLRHSKYDNYFQITTIFSLFPLKQRHISIFILLNFII